MTRFCISHIDYVKNYVRRLKNSIYSSDIGNLSLYVPSTFKLPFILEIIHWNHCKGRYHVIFIIHIPRNNNLWKTWKNNQNKSVSHGLDLFQSNKCPVLSNICIFICLCGYRNKVVKMQQDASNRDVNPIWHCGIIFVLVLWIATA